MPAKLRGFKMHAPNKPVSIFPNTPSKEIVRSFISEAAYYKAEKRGFEPGHEEQDWSDAEREVKNCLNNYFDLTIHSTYN